MAAQTTASVVAQGIYTLVPFFQSTFSLTQAEAALAVSAVNFGQVLTMLMMGWFIDKHGERSVVCLTMLFMGLAAMAAGLMNSYIMVLGCLALVGASYASVQPGGTRAILRWFASDQRAMATGIRQAGLPFGSAVAAMLLPAVAYAHGWDTALFAAGAVGLMGAVLFGLTYRGAESSGSTPVEPLPSLPKLVREVARYRALWPVMFAGVAMVTFQYTFSTHALSFLMERFGMTAVMAGALYSVTQWVGIAGRIGLAWTSDHFWPGRRMRSLVGAMLVCITTTLVLALMPQSTPTWLLVGLFVVVGVFGVGWYPLYLLQVAEMAPKSSVATTISFSMTLNMVAITVAPPLFGAVVDVGGFSLAWALLAVVVVLAMANLAKRQDSTELARARETGHA
ncbi:MFS transporter [Azotobacter chroococcum]|uniref:MFS transporter n=1 Tax=Azotobacter chroococcum TaxID=353 RepID=UPI001A95160E|nr:MFS transporter [Azotobacter chroococcum]